MNSDEAKAEIKRLSDECENLLKAKIRKLKDEKRLRDPAGRVIRKTIKDPRGRIISQGEDDE